MESTFPHGLQLRNGYAAIPAESIVAVGISPLDLRYPIISNEYTK